MDIEIKMIQELRDKTGAGIVNCKKALTESGGNMEQAVDLLRKKGQKIAASKAERAANEGLIEAYIHANGQVGSLVEITCESDFVSKNEEFRSFAHDVAMQVAATNPLYLAPEDVPEEIMEKEKSIYRDQMKDENKPDDIIEKIIDGKVQKYYQENCLMKQAFIKDDKVTMEALLKSMIAKLGENMQIKRFVRFSV